MSVDVRTTTVVEPLAGGGYEAEGVSGVEARSPWQQAWRRLKRDRLAIISGVMIIFMILLAFVGAPIAEKIVGHGPNDIISGGVENFQPVGPWSEVSDGKGGQTMLVLGASDLVGRDEFLRLLYGARVSLEVGILATLSGSMLGRDHGHARRLLRRGDGHAGVPLDRDHHGVPAAAVPDRHLGDGRRPAERHHVRRALISRGVQPRAGDHPVHVVLPGAHHQIAGALAAREGVRRGRAHGRLVATSGSCARTCCRTWSGRSSSTAR